MSPSCLATLPLTSSARFNSLLQELRSRATSRALLKIPSNVSCIITIHQFSKLLTKSEQNSLKKNDYRTRSFSHDSHGTSSTVSSSPSFHGSSENQGKKAEYARTLPRRYTQKIAARRIHTPPKQAFRATKTNRLQFITEQPSHGSSRTFGTSGLRNPTLLYSATSMTSPPPFTEFFTTQPCESHSPVFSKSSSSAYQSAKYSVDAAAHPTT